MKGIINIFCSSQSAAAMSLTSMEQQPSSSSRLSRSNMAPSSSPAIDRYNPIIKDASRISKTPPNFHHSNNNNNNKAKNRRIPLKESSNEDHGQSKKSSEISTTHGDDKIEEISTIDVDSVVKNGEFIISPSGSTRFLLKEKGHSYPLPDSHSALDLDLFADEETPNDHPEQVVVLRVSLHCRGCERKLRKHLSKMEGVTSFSIDFAAKKVIVSGKVTPLGVLSSISKVKNAQLWSPTILSSPKINLTNGNEV